MQPNDEDPIPDIDVNLDNQPAPRTRHSADPRRKKKPGGGRTKPWVIILICLAAAAVGFAVYWFVLKKDNAETMEPVDNTTETTPEEQSPPMNPEDASKMATFKSEKLKLELSHRGDWTVVESDDGNSITLTSPSISYQTINGTVPEGSGVFTLRIVKGVSSAQRDVINNAIAVQKSEVIAYAKPTEAQRHYTNVSYGGTEDAFTFLMVTGAVEFAKGDPWAGKISLSSADYYLIAGGFGADAENTMEFDQVAASQIDSDAAKQATAIIESLRIF
jgi:hypothetical protein